MSRYILYINKPILSCINYRFVKYLKLGIKGQYVLIDQKGYGSYNIFFCKSMILTDGSF